MLHGRVNELLEIGETHDVVKPRAYLPAAQSQDRAVEIYVLRSREVGVESSAELQERRDTAPYGYRPLGGAHGAREQSQEGALARAVGAYYAQCFTLLRVEGYALEGPEILPRLPATYHAQHGSLEGMTAPVLNKKPLSYFPDFNCFHKNLAHFVR